MRLKACIVGFGGVLAMAGASAACAQTWAPNAFDASPDVEARLTEQTSFRVAPDARFGAQIEIPTAFRPDDRSGLSASTRNDVWIDRTDFTDRVTLETAGRLRRADGSPLPVTPVDRAELDPDAYDLRYVRGFRGARGHTASGLEVSLTPHAGLGVGSEGRSAEAGVTLKIGEGLDRLAPNGREPAIPRTRAASWATPRSAWPIARATCRRRLASSIARSTPARVCAA
jgi:hypothetical protein